MQCAVMNRFVISVAIVFSCPIGFVSFANAVGLASPETSNPAPSVELAELGNPTETRNFALGINSHVGSAINDSVDREDVVGISQIGNGDYHAFLYDARSVQGLNTLIYPSSRWTAEEPREINERREISLGSTDAAAAIRADTTTVTFVSDLAGDTPFIHKLNFNISSPGNLRRVQFTIQPKAGSVTRPISASYPSAYLISRGFLIGSALQVPVFGLYDNFTNSVTLTWIFDDNSTKQSTLQIATAAYADPCGTGAPIVVQPRTNSTSLTYDYILLRRNCTANSPAILDTDGALRWVGTAAGASVSSAFFDNSVYMGLGPQLVRIEMDGAVSVVADYSSIAVENFHHNIEAGKHGLILEVDTAADFESTLLEVDKDGRLLKRWNMAEIISAAMSAGGDDPSGFVRRDEDWFHNNAATYRASDDTLIVSSRENFVIALDYETSTIKWILGDPTKAWYQYPSLRAFALSVSSGPPPIGQHALSITHDDKLLLFDNGFNSLVQMPPGILRTHAIARKYSLDLTNRTAAQLWNYDSSTVSEICSSVYQDAPDNYLVDYAVAGGFMTGNAFAEIQGLQEDGSKVFDYKYPTEFCETIYNAYPLHLEHVIYRDSTADFGGVLSNFSGRAIGNSNDNVLIGGFIIRGSSNKRVVLRGTGPSLTQFGLSQVAGDPVLSLFRDGKLIARNDNYVPSAELSDAGLTPGSSQDSVILTTLSPGEYTAILSDSSNSSGTGLLEVYQIVEDNAEFLDISVRGRVESGDNVLIGGLIVGSNSLEVAVRALGPTLGSYGVTDFLRDPFVTLYNADGIAVAANDDWKTSQQVSLTNAGFGSINDREAALLTTLAPGNYTAIVTSRSETMTSGTALLEIYDLAVTSNQTASNIR
jgi:arylsulfate sulfotransferase